MSKYKQATKVVTCIAETLLCYLGQEMTRLRGVSQISSKPPQKFLDITLTSTRTSPFDTIIY